MRGSNWKALTALWIGGRLRQVVAYGGWLYHNTLHSSVLSLSKIYCLYGLDQGLQPSHQEGSIHSPADDGMPPEAPKDDHVFRRLNLRPPSQSRAEWNSAVYSLPYSSACFSSYCCLTPSASQINGVYLHTRSDGNLSRLRANTKVRKVLIRDKRECCLNRRQRPHQLLFTRL